jgi:hypothetical protein
MRRVMCKVVCRRTFRLCARKLRFSIKQGREHQLTEAVFRYLVQYIRRELVFPLHAHQNYGDLYNANNIGHPKSDSLYLVPFGHT